MSTFADELERLCLTHCRSIKDFDEGADATHAVAAALAATIAMTMFGHPKATAECASVIADALPEMVERRAAAVREILGKVREARQ